MVNKLDTLTNISEGPKTSLDKVRNDLLQLPVEINSLTPIIKDINTIADSQRSLWKKQYELQREEFNRQPELKISANVYENDSSIVINRIVLDNFGDDVANIVNFKIKIPQGYTGKFLISDVKPHLEDTAGIYETYSLAGAEFMQPQIITTKPMKFDLTLAYHKKFDAYVGMITVIVDYISRYTNGSISNSFVILYFNKKLEVKKLNY